MNLKRDLKKVRDEKSEGDEQERRKDLMSD